MKATASRIARTKCGFPWASVKPNQTPRARGSYSGLKAPMRWGSIVSPSDPGATVAAKSVRRSYALRPSAAARATSASPNRSRNQVSVIPPVGQTGQ